MKIYQMKMPEGIELYGQIQDAALRVQLPDAASATGPASTTGPAGWLDRMLDQLAEEPARHRIRVLILTGIENLSRRLTTAEWTEFRRAISRLEDQGRPTIAVIDGHAAGPACELALACHWRIGTRRASFQESAAAGSRASIGIQPADGRSGQRWASRLTGIVGQTLALELILTGRSLSSEEASSAGILQRQVESRAAALELASRLAARLAAGAPLSIEWANEAVRRGAQLPLEAGLAIETGLFTRSVATPDAREGVRAFLEKRPPRFTGDRSSAPRPD